MRIVDKTDGDNNVPTVALIHLTMLVIKVAKVAPYGRLTMLNTVLIAFTNAPRAGVKSSMLV